MNALPQAVAVIVDISKSRSHADRARLQDDVIAALARVNDETQPTQPLEPTVGDEFQGSYGDVPAALHATLLTRLFLPEGVECRFGLGLGDLRIVGESRVGAVQDGSAWWSAREAIGEAREREYARLGFVRTWYRSGIDDPGCASEALVNAFLLTRDHLVSAMNPRERRLLLGQLLGETQADLARREGITQSAVSQNLHRSGAIALLAGAALFAEAAPSAARHQEVTG